MKIVAGILRKIDFKVNNTKHIPFLGFKKSNNSPKGVRKMAQSRIESNRRLPLTSFDHIDDEIIDKGIFDIHSNKAK